MKMRSGLLIGFGIGYVLGAKAGRERYEQLRTMWSRVMGMPVVQQTAVRTKEAATAGARRGLTVVQQGVERAGGAVRERLHGGGGPTDDIIDVIERGEGRSPDAPQPDGAKEAFHPNP